MNTAAIHPNVQGLLDLLAAEGKTYSIPEELKTVLANLGEVWFEELEELDDHTWGVLITTMSASYRMFTSIRAEDLESNSAIGDQE